MGTIVGVNELARHLCTNREGLARLEEAGVIGRLSDGKSYDQDVCRAAYIAHLRARPTARSSKQDKLYKARADLARMRAQQLAGQLCRTADFTDAWVDAVGYMTAGIVAIPARCTRDTALRRTIERELDAWRTDAADYFQRRAAELEGKGGKAA